MKTLADASAISHCITTLRSVRRFREADVDPELIEFVLRHATRAGSAKNRQPWRFVVIRSPEARAALARWYREGYQRLSAWAAGDDVRADAPPDENRQMAHAAELATHFDTVPVVIVACYLATNRNPANFFAGASIYPAVQNLLLAAHAVGLGATLTTLHAVSTTSEDELRDLLGLPLDAVPAALLPMGWPVDSLGAGRRKPVTAVTFAERWGEPWGR